MFYEVEELNLLKGMKISKNNIPIHHMLFADDLTILVWASSTDVQTVKKI